MHMRSSWQQLRSHLPLEEEGLPFRCKGGSDPCSPSPSGIQRQSYKPDPPMPARDLETSGVHFTALHWTGILQPEPKPGPGLRSEPGPEREQIDTQRTSLSLTNQFSCTISNPLLDFDASYSSLTGSSSIPITSPRRSMCSAASALACQVKLHLDYLRPAIQFPSRPLTHSPVEGH